jgi:magnesium chelatase family protein
VRVARLMASGRPGEVPIGVAACPCPCAPAHDRDCRCSPQARRRYVGRLSGPLLAR